MFDQRLLAELERTRGSRALALLTPKLRYPLIYVLYECLRELGHVKHLDLVLWTKGGDIPLARRLALLLHTFTDHLTILVPDAAESAGTLLCLAAHELVLGPMASLGPLDPQISASASESSAAQPLTISAEDVRAFREMAEAWFGVNGADQRLQVLSLLGQRVFPTTLSNFFRADRLVREVAEELLAYQLPEQEGPRRAQIVDRLVRGYHAHDYPLTRVDARRLGLRAVDATPEEESLLWQIAAPGHQQVNARPEAGRELLTGVIATTTFLAQHVERYTLHGSGALRPVEGGWVVRPPVVDKERR